jgi:hypothetical protein
MTPFRLLLGCSLLVVCLGKDGHAAAPIDVIPRSAWGARATSGACVPHIISSISVHHTATHSTDNTKSPKRLLSYQRYHQDSKGWTDLAYHLFIDLEGNVYAGRDTACVGDTATNYDPKGHLLIVLEGNFEKQAVSSKAFERLAEVVTWGAEKFSVDSAHVRAHRDLAATACPGAHLYAKLADGTLATRIQALGATQAPTIRMLSQTEGEARIQQITQPSLK